MFSEEISVRVGARDILRLVAFRLVLPSQLLKGKADEGKEYLKRRGSELRDSAGEIIERGKEVISRQKDTLAEAVEAGKQAYREAVGQPAGAESQMAR